MNGETEGECKQFSFQFTSATQWQQSEVLLLYNETRKKPIWSVVLHEKVSEKCAYLNTCTHHRNERKKNNQQMKIINDDKMVKNFCI